MDQSMPGGMI
jgi:pumilio RNA-binding family